MSDFRAFLLDLHLRHPLINSDIGYRIDYYTDLERCVQAVENARATCRRIDLFLPVQNSNIINGRLPLFENIYFHLYCPTVDEIPYYEGLYPQRAYIQVFEEDLMWVNISHAVLAHDHTRLITNFTPQAREQYETTNRIVLEEIEAAKLSIETVERRMSE